jgi:hypothetical protein
LPHDRTPVTDLAALAAGWTDDVDLPQVVKDPADHNEANWLYGYDPDTSTGAYLYLAAERDDPQLRRESVFVYLPDGSVLAGSGAGRGTRERVAAGGRLEMECVEPWRRWVCRYEAPMQRLVGDELVSGPPRARAELVASVALDVTMVSPVWNTEGTWGEQPPSLRYHQFYEAAGRIEVDGAVHEFGGFGFRSHSRRRRDNMQGYTGHAILNGWFPGSGRGFGLLRYRATADLPERGRGFLYVDGQMRDADVVDWPHLTEARTSGDRARVELVTDDGTTAVITGETVVAPYVTVGAGGRRLGVHADDGATFTLSPAVCRWEWDGEVTYGPLERSARPQSLTVNTDT